MGYSFQTATMSEHETEAFLKQKELDDPSLLPKAPGGVLTNALGKEGFRAAALLLAGAILFFLLAVSKDGDTVFLNKHAPAAEADHHALVTDGRYNKDMVRLADARIVTNAAIMQMEKDYGDAAKALFGSMQYYNRDVIK